VGVVCPDLVVDLVEGLHELLLVVLLDHVAVLVVLGESGEEGPELEPIVAVADVFQQQVLGVALEDVQREIDCEEVGDLLLETGPHFSLLVGQTH